MDEAVMREAVALGERGRVTAPPNPWVGCVLVADGEVVGRGFHTRAGEPHAEPVALAEAGDAARGATAYVTLEPCPHHGRTPPCADALVAAGVSRVVVGVEDADPRVRGQGVERLRAAGVEVVTGVEAEAVGESLRPYLHQRATGRPWCVLKGALGIDGRPAAADGSSQWITGAEARADAHRLRAESQAVVVGSGTALADRPALTVRDTDPKPPAPPLRVLLDRRGRVPAEGPLFDTDEAPTLVVTTGEADPEAVRAWKAAGAEVEEVGAGLGLGGVLDLLGRRGVLQALFEGGAAVHGALVRDDLADQIVTYVGGVLLGDGGRPFLADLPVPTLADAPRWQLADVARLGDDARLTWRRPGPERPFGAGR